MKTSQETTEAFWEQFLLPLVRGGEVHVGRPLDRDDLEILDRETLVRGRVVSEIDAWRLHRASELVHSPAPIFMDQAAVRLAVAAHNLLFLSHPRLDRWTASERARTRVEELSRWCLQLQAPRSEGEVLARHTLLGNLPELARKDTILRYWAGRRVFRGTDPPTRLLRWRRVRRVRTEVTSVPWVTTRLSLPQLNLLVLLLKQSPLTDLLYPARDVPAFNWLGPHLVLQSRGLCRVVCRHYLEQGLQQVGPALARAFWALIQERPPGQHQRGVLMTVVGMVQHLYAVTCLLDPRDPGAFVGSTPPSARESLGSVLVAAEACGLSPTQQVLGGPAMARRMEGLLAAFRVVLGEEAVGELAAGLRRALGI